MPLTFEAKFPGRCGRCDNRIDPGDSATYVDDELVHTQCDTESSREDDPGEVCPDCWTIHRGECI